MFVTSPDQIYKQNFTIGNSTRTRLHELAVSLMDSSEFGRHSEYIEKQGWPKYFGDMAAVLTIFVQNRAQPASKRIMGQAYGMDTFMEVQWIWFSMPLFLVVSSTLLLVFTARRSSKKKYLFKSSALAVVFHGLEQEASDFEEPDMGKDSVDARLGGKVTSAMLNKMARDYKVRLGTNAKGELKLLKAD
jgi:hypothetical protein